MTYSSLLFIYGFLPLSLLIYWLTPEKMKNTSLLLLSMLFCALNSFRFLKFMVVYTLINYFAGLFIGKFRNKKSISAIPLFLGISADVVMFFMFRTDFLDIFKNKLKIPCEFFPVGVSFITLTAIGYLIDIYKKCIRPEFDIVKFSLYMMMFPLIIMRPVIRYNTFRRMINDRKVTLCDTGTGLTIFVKGLVKKVIAGDTMYAMYIAVKSVDIWNMSSVNAWLGMTAYLLSLYFTLSGMADMGAGTGYCFGFRFPHSFNYPVFSNKMRDFASNWHVQIIYWFRRYMSKPLCEMGKSRVYRKIIFISAWCCVGLWYRFDMNGLLWGGIIGLTVVLEKYIRRFRILKITGIIYTYVITIIGIVFLSGENIGQSLNYLLVLLGGNKIFADSLTLYLLKYYIVLMLVCTYCSTSLFRNMVMRSGKSHIKSIIALLSPVVTLVMLVLCTAIISYTGSSELYLISL
ncbi:MAG: hypothetical protein K2K66_05960 [Ruminococcus sp.]|nr:hypothetical protein [Ruminococcus sp.]